MGIGMDTKGCKTENSQAHTGGLVLYYHPHSFYSQKILFALYEKGIPFDAVEVDTTAGEQYSKWFLQLNPKGEVPVLQNGNVIVPDSGRIISYLEENFPDVPRLYSPELPTKQIGARVLYFHKRISRIPIGAISMGSFVHHNLSSTDTGTTHESTVQARPPFDRLTQASIIDAEHKVRQILEQYAAVDPGHAHVLLDRIHAQERKRAVIENRSDYMTLIDAVHAILGDVEAELMMRNEDSKQWLCCNEFTIADLSLVMLLSRLYHLGLESFFWTRDRPLIEGYFERARERHAYRRLMATVAAKTAMAQQPLPTKAQPLTLAIQEIWTKISSAQLIGAATAISAALLLVVVTVAVK